MTRRFGATAVLGRNMDRVAPRRERGGGPVSKIAVIGLGEVGGIFARDLVDKGAMAAAFDTASAAQAQAEARNLPALDEMLDALTNIGRALAWI